MSIHNIKENKAKEKCHCSYLHLLCNLLPASNTKLDKLDFTQAINDTK